MFNALKYTKQLEQVGFSREQAEIQLQIIGEVLEGDLVTKQDFKLLEAKMESGFDGLSKKVEYEIANLSGRLEHEVADIGGRFERLENRLTIRFGAFLFVGLTALASLIKFWLAK